MAKDLHTTKGTHMSLPLKNKEIEFHLRNDEVTRPKKFTAGKKYGVKFTVKATSSDKEGHRYRNTGLPEVTEAKPGRTRREDVKKPYTH